MWCGSKYDEQQETIVYGQWILLVFISLHPLNTSVGGKFQTAQLQSDSIVSVVHVILVGTFNIVLWIRCVIFLKLIVMSQTMSLE